MSTPEHPETPQLTRKQLRDIRTGSTPIIDMTSSPVITADEVPANPSADEENAGPPPFEESLPPVTPPSPATPLARAAEPVLLPAPPAADRSVDLGVTPLTRRQARQQERIRTASVPVITPEISAAYAMQALVAGSEAHAAAPEAPVDEASPADTDTAEGAVEEQVSGGEAESAGHTDSPEDRDEDAPEQADVAEIVEEPSDLDEQVVDEEPEQDVARSVAPDFGAALLAGGGPAEPELPSSFDELIAHSSSGSVATPNALILSQIPNGGSIVAPVNATGEVLITGTFNLPEGLGSTGHAIGTADGKETDAVLVDGELPAHSSPTPIAASAAISTAKQPGEIIKPPTPEKSGKLMLTLAITAGVLALALVGVLILAVTTGVF